MGTIHPFPKKRDRQSSARRRWRPLRNGKRAGRIVAARPFALFLLLVALWIWLDPALVEVPDWATGQPERVASQFTRCAPGQRQACVIDGDTIRMGNRRIRIIGIDTPEVEARCPKEAVLAEAATVHLQKLLNEAPFEMVPRVDDPVDRYGRELRALRRLGPDGNYRSLAAAMRDSGLARRYMGGFRRSWC